MASSKIKNGKTIDSVVKGGLCTGCGTCVGLCPEEAVGMTIDYSKGIYIPRLDEERCNQCGVCLAVCPGHTVDFKQLNSGIFGYDTADILLGNYANCYTGYATDSKIRYDSASGGLVTLLLIFALEEGMIDGALVTRMSEDNPLEPEPFIARTREEIISAAKSKYCPVPANIALSEIIKEEGRFAVVGLPCHIQGVRKAEMANKKLKEKIVLHLGLFCNHAPSFLATEYILRNMKVKKQQVKKLDYRGEGWPGIMKIGLENRELSISLSDYWESGFGSFFYPRRCLFCIDALSELADISFGDAWLREFRDEKLGQSMVISRTGVGQQILERAVRQGAIELAEMDPTEIKQSQGILLRRRKAGANAHMSFLRALHKKTPVYTAELLRPGIKDHVGSLRLYLRTHISTKRNLWGLMRMYILSKLHKIAQY